MDTITLCPSKISLNLIKHVEKLDPGPYAGGATCDIWRCRLPGSGRELESEEIVAVKVLRAHIYNSESITAQETLGNQIRREIEVWSSLNHENVLPLVGIKFWGPLPSFISPWMTNGTASSYLRSSAHHEIDFHKFVVGIIDGLTYLHSKDLIHGDIRGNNILVSEDGVPKIGDFGLSRIIKSGDLASTVSTNIKGTIRWMATELFDECSASPSHTKESDVWAFGMTLYELYFDVIPYAQLKDARVMREISLGNPPVFPEESPEDWGYLRSWVEEICKTCWRTNPDSRPRMDEMHFSFGLVTYSPASSPPSPAVIPIRIDPEIEDIDEYIQLGNMDQQRPQIEKETTPEGEINSANRLYSSRSDSGSTSTVTELQLSTSTDRKAISEFHAFLQAIRKSDFLRWHKEQFGQDHCPIWRLICSVGEKEYGRAEAPTVKLAQEAAAQQALVVLRQEYPAASSKFASSTLYDFNRHVEVKRLTNEWTFSSIGEPHNQTWFCRLYINGNEAGEGQGVSKKAAMRIVAENFINIGIQP